MKKKIAKCRTCGQPLDKLVHAQTGTYTGSRQCINHECKQYGKVAPLRSIRRSE